MRHGQIAAILIGAGDNISEELPHCRDKRTGVARSDRRMIGRAIDDLNDKIEGNIAGAEA